MIIEQTAKQGQFAQVNITLYRQKKLFLEENYVISSDVPKSKPFSSLEKTSPIWAIVLGRTKKPTNGRIQNLGITV